MTFTTIRYPALPENHCESRRAHPPGFAPGEPYYEPDHLRHRPGDTWKIGGRPYDPQDPGPYGSPGWFQDRRTGRHRRNELPDPLPAEEERPGATPRSPLGSEVEPSYEFTPLQEDAWGRWLIDSAPLAAAHTRPAERNKVLAAVIVLARCIASLVGFGTAGGRPRESPGEAGTGRRPGPAPAPGSGRANAWELHFDARSSVTGGAVR